MKVNKATFEQHIAVFGESGSGKTVLVSSFYGATQEPQFLKKSLFHVVSDDIGQGSHLHRNYLGMRDSARAPEPTRFTPTSYAFSVILKDSSGTKQASTRPFDALRLVWHDYPGEWFEQDVSGPEEARRRIDTFRSLMRSDVAILLIDGQRLLDHAGEEERYLKLLFSNFRNVLLTLKNDLLDGGTPRVEFPRIWILALSKADVLPGFDVFKFRDLLIEKAVDDLNELRQVLGGIVQDSEALSVGEDFVILSSAKFEVGRIEVAKRVGLDLILPLAAILPFERHVRWAKRKRLPAKVAENLLDGAGVLAAALVGARVKKPGLVGMALKLMGTDTVAEAARLAGEKLRAVNATAMAKQDFVSATLTSFQINLNDAEEQQILLRSLK